MADALSYNLKQDVVIAAGNVSLTDITGDVTFADYMELTGDMKTASAQGIRMLLIDDSRIAANDGHRVAGDRSVFDKGVYTACKPCADDSDTPPLWQIKANRIVHDEVEHQVEYTDAWLEMGGIPIGYTPYMSHADPSVKRASGLLPPSVVNNQIVGSGVRTPYFAVIDDYQDATVSPLFSSNGYDQLAVVHRWRNVWGGTKTTFSIADMPQSAVEVNSTVGWHVDAYGRFDIDDTWRAGYQVQRASDRYYLSTFNYHTTDPYLTTRPYLEGFSERNYTAVEGYTFESLTAPTGTPTTTPTTPVVLPMGTYSYVGDPDSSTGGYWTFDAHGAVIWRQQGTNGRRVNTQTAWDLPYTADDGEIYKLSASVRLDAYNSDHVTPGDPKQVNTTRGIPNVTLDWRYPFTRLGEHSSQTLTPIVVTSLSPYGGNSLRIPNEDSLDFELDDTNIFKPNPGTGYDRVLTGPHVAYGGQYTVVNRGLGAADFLFGQMLQAHPQAIFPTGSGLDRHMSDYVGRANVSPSSNLSVQYSFRLDQGNFGIRRSEVSTSIGPKALNLQTSYVFYDRLSPSSPFDAREQISGTLTAQASHFWSTQLYTVQNLGPGAGTLQTGLRLTYEDECFLMTADAGEKYTTVKTFSAGHYFMFRIYFKTLAQFPVDVF
jgi:LPS-assembly protein